MNVQASDWRGKKVTVVGLGIEGADLARYFAAKGAQVTVSDAKSREALAARINELEPLGVRFSLGSNDPAVTADADLVCVSQGVPLSIPALTAARDRGVPIESMTSLFFQLCPGPIVGITGSSGKTTTTSLVDAILTAAGRKHVLGGNIGIGLMSLLDDLAPDTTAVLEVSHSQLTIVKKSPQIAALLSVTPNHLDQFTWEEYVALKRNIFAFQTPNDTAVFNLDDPVSRELMGDARGRKFLFSITEDHGQDGAFVVDQTVFWRRDGRSEAVVRTSEIPLRGVHNVANVAAATAIAAACDIPAEAVTAAVREFKAPAHRLEFVARINEIDYYNDSIATAPERTLAALRSFEEPIVLLLGGRDKNLPLDSLETEVGRRCRAVVCFGESGSVMARGIANAAVRIERVDLLASAVELASALAQPGDVVLLSPACTSFDAYDNFEQRGADFRQIVASLAPEYRPVREEAPR